MNDNKQSSKKVIKVDTRYDEYLTEKLSYDLDKNLDYIKKTMGESMDLIARDMIITTKEKKVRIGIAHLNGLSDAKLINDTILETLPNRLENASKEDLEPHKILDYFKYNLILMSELNEASDFANLFISLLYGDTILLIEGVNKCLFIGTKSYKERAIEKPSTNITVKGGKDSFTENLATNLALIRRRIRNPNLWIKKYIIGKTSNTLVALCYLNGVAEKKLIDEVERRINNIKTDNIIDASYVMYHLREKQKTIFPLMVDAERPDLASASLLEGRVLVLVDGSPFVIVAPSNFLQSLHSPDDFYMKTTLASFFRITRGISFFISLFIPAIYLTLEMFHSELLPIDLLYNIAGQRIGVPLPAIIEIFLLMIAFDLIREASTRMPAAIGPSLSFIGAIIIGEAAVQAGLVTFVAVIITTITALGTLAMADFDLSLAVTFLRYALYIIAAFFGLLGVVIGALLILTHLVSLKSFGVPYLTPLSPFKKKALGDSIIRAPIGTVVDKTPSPIQDLPS